MKITRLLEDIDAVKKYYPDIPSDKFDELIALDPTFNSNRDSIGTYGKWILNLYRKEGHIERPEHLTDVLTRFHSERNNLKNKDINTFKSVDLLDEYLNDDDSYKDLTTRQQLRRVQKSVHGVDLGKDADLVFETQEWEVWVPKTYRASCKLGQGSNWCTATTSTDYYYKHYVEKGPLYINIRKSDSEKWQFHSQTKSFMDKKDRPVNLEQFLLENTDLLQAYATTIPCQGILYTTAKNLVKRLEIIRYYEDEEHDTFEMTSSTKDAFKYCKDLVHHVVTKGMRMIPDDMFQDVMTIKTITLNEGVVTIGNRCFRSCVNLETINIPSTLQLIGYNAFEGCSQLTDLTINTDKGLRVDDYAFARCNSLVHVSFSNVSSLGVGVFQSCSRLTNVELSGDITDILPNMFIGCPELRYVTLPETVKRIQTAAFRGCPAITSFIAPSNLLLIASNVFEGCTELEKVDLQRANVETIGSRAFASCPKLTTITIPATVETVGSGVFDNNKTNVTIYSRGDHWKPDWNKGNKGSVKNV